MTTLKKALNAEAVLPWENDFELDVSTEKLPTVSIVIPIYNSAKFLEKTLRSLICNDLKGVELILMDGGSNDGTMEIVAHYEEIFAHTQSKKDAGQSDAINKGYERATGEILYWLNGDDIILPNTLNKIRRYYKAHKECDVLVGNAFMTELDFTPIHHFIFSKEKLRFENLLDYAKNHLIQPSVFFTRKAWELAGPLDVHDHYAMDADLFIGMAKNFDMHHINEDIAYSVYHEECKTRGARSESITSLALVQAKHGGMVQAKATLNILVDLYHQLENEINNAPSNALTKALAAKVAAMEARTLKQQELCLKLDLEAHQ